MKNRALRVFSCFYPVGAGTSLARIVSNYWATPIITTLRQEMQCDVLTPQGINLGLGYGRCHDSEWMSTQRPRYTEILVEQVKAAHREKPIDLLLSYFCSSQIEPGGIDDIKRLGIPCVNFFCDNLHAFEQVEEIAPRFDLNWVAERKACEIYRARGLPYVYLPMAACPSYHYHASDVPEDLDVAFCGSFNVARIELLGQARDRGLPVHVFGGETGALLPPEQPRGLARRCAQWVRVLSKSLLSHVAGTLRYGLAEELHRLRMEAVIRRYRDFPRELLHPNLPDEEIVRLYARSKVSLGINRIWLGNLSFTRTVWYCYPRLRDFEATMSGACYLTEYAEEHDDLFAIGEEVEVYRTADELIEKANALLGDPARRARMRACARHAALTRHTWRHRLEKAFAAVGLRASA